MEFYNDEERNIQEEEQPTVTSEKEYLELVRAKQNEFLDSYVEYLDSSDALAKKILKRKALDLEGLDPNFQFIIE